MVSRFVYRLLTCVLALALPLQGFAASSMLLCGPMHEDRAPVHAAAPATTPQHAVASHGAELSLSGAAAQAPSETLPKSEHATKVLGKCSLCAACAAVALPSQAVVLAATPGTSVYDVAAFKVRAGFLTGGIERPPRPFLA